MTFIGEFGYWSIILVVMAFYFLMSIELISEEIEDPFGRDINDLPLDELCVKIKKNIIEILLHIELENIDLVESRILSFKRNYFKFLLEINQKRAITYLNLVHEYFKSPETVSSKTFKNKVENSFEWVSGQQEDIFVMSFYAWLKSKMEATDIYLTTLNLVQEAQNVN